MEMLSAEETGSFSAVSTKFLHSGKEMMKWKVVMSEWRRVGLVRVV